MRPPELLAVRYGVFTAAEVARFGIATTSGSRLRAFRMAGSVYSLLPPPWTAEQRWTAGVLAGGPGALLFGETLLEAFGLVPVSANRPVDVLVPATTRRRDTAFVSFRRSRAPLPAGYAIRGRLTRPLASDVGVAAAPALVAHLATYYQAAEVRATLATLTQKRLVRLSEVSGWAAKHPRVPGAKIAAWAAGELAGGLQSEGEVRLHQTARDLGLAPDETQVKIWHGRQLVSVTDAFWSAGVAGYFDGAVHMQHAMHQADIARRERLRTAGLLVLEVTSVTLVDRKAFRRALETRLEQARAGIAVRRWSRSDRGIELDTGF